MSIRLKENVFLMCAVALAVVVSWIHIQFLTAMPDPIFQPDSGSYLNPALDWFYGQVVHFPSSRTVGYPIWIGFWLTLIPHFIGLLIAQHALVLVTAAIAAVVAHRFFEVPRWGVLPIFVLVGTSPRWIVYSHCILVDAVYASALMVNVFVLLIALKKPQSRRWVCLAVGAWWSLLLRPVGLSFVLSVALILMIKAVQNKSERVCRAGIFTFLLLMLLTCAANARLRGFWGLDQFGGVSLFGMTARYLSPENFGQDLLPILLPIYKEHTGEWKQENWVRFSPNGPVAALAKVIPDSGRLDHYLMRLSLKGIGNHPFYFLRDQLVLFFTFIWERSARPDHVLPKEVTVGRGLAMYADQIRTHPLAETLVSFKPSLASTYFDTLTHESIYPYEAAGLGRLLWPWVYAVRWIGVSSLLLTPFLLMKKELRLPTLVLWLVIVSHIVLTDLGGDGDGRHAIPVEPFFIILTFAGIHRAINETKAHLKFFASRSPFDAPNRPDH